MSIFYSQWKFNDIRKRFNTDFPDICNAAEKSLSVDDFKIILKNICTDETISRLIEFDGQTITDYSTGKEVIIHTISLLYNFLLNIKQDYISIPGSNTSFISKDANNEATHCPDADNEATMDLLTDLYFIFYKSFGKEPIKPVTEAKVTQWTKQWISGANPVVQQIREENKQRIIKKLIQKLERKGSLKYIFPESCSFEEKQQLVDEWWNNYRFHLAMAIKSPDRKSVV